MTDRRRCLRGRTPGRREDPREPGADRTRAGQGDRRPARGDPSAPHQPLRRGPLSDHRGAGPGEDPARPDHRPGLPPPKFQRIQFTPDLMPADITGTEILEETSDGRRRIQFVKGPIFANVVLADEINRTPPKTQAALLEAMQEHQVTAAGVRYPLEEPFFVLATQNPIEMEGTYPLPEAQLDRFMFNVIVDYLARGRRGRRRQPDDLEEARADRAPVRRSRRPQVPRGRPQGADRRGARPPRGPAGRRDPPRPRRARLHQRVGELGRRPPSRPVAWCWGPRPEPCSPAGSTPRPKTSVALVHPTLRHRVLLGYRAEADGVTVDAVIDRLLDHMKGPLS